jgi:hypothetical protein
MTSSENLNRINEIPSVPHGSFIGTHPDHAFNSQPTTGESPVDDFGVRIPVDDFGVRIPVDEFGVRMPVDQFGVRIPVDEFGVRIEDPLEVPGGGVLPGFRSSEKSDPISTNFFKDQLRKTKAAGLPVVPRDKKRYTQKLKFQPSDATPVDLKSFLQDQEFCREIEKNIDENAVPWTASSKIMEEFIVKN